MMLRVARARLGSGLGLLLFLLACGHAHASVAEDDAIQSASLDYAEGWLTGDAERVTRALHPAMLKRRVVTDLLSDTQSVQEVNAETLIRATQEGVGIGGGPLSFRVAILDRHGDQAVVRIVSSLYVEYLHMVRWEERWVILNVLWGTIAAPGE
jgi:hypothetical protein